MSTENLPQSPDPQPRKPRVAVVFGGRSSEHGISVVTAGAVLRAIHRDKYDVLPIAIVLDVPEEVCAERNAARVDRADMPRRVIQRHIRERDAFAAEVAVERLEQFGHESVIVLRRLSR